MARLGIQTILFRERMNGGDGLPDILKDIKAAGYDGAEVGNLTGTMEPDAARALFDRAEVACCGYHTGYKTFMEINDLPPIANHLLAVGSPFLMCSGTGGRDRDGYLRSAEIFNRAGAILAENGVALCYHNHNWEFAPLDGGGTGMDILLKNTDASVVKLCVDIYWVACAGLDPAAFIRENAVRSVYFHYKDGKFDAPSQQPLSFGELGTGQVDLASAHQAVLELSPDWLVTEQDRTDGDPFTSARISADYARNVLKI